MRRAALVVAVLAALVLTVPARAAGEPVRESGYLAMADGVRLRYTVVRPPGDGPFPTLFEYSGYDPGTHPDASHVRRFVEQDGGYAYVGVNLRGTGCSEGTFDFFQPQEAVDGAAVIEWIIEQPWSDGSVGMIGKSYPGITQLFVAARRPPGLVAIAPGHFYADAYRDIARPGGITNYGFSSLWSFIGRPSYEFGSSPGEVAGGDTDCLNGSTAELRGLPTNPFVQLLQHPYDDELVRERSPITYLDDIDLPMLATLSWQDEQLGSRQTDLLAALDDRGSTNWWATLSNGDHGMARTATELADLERFYDHFLKGEDNGWETRPRVQVWWEAGRDAGERAPGWVTALDHWSESTRSAAGELTAWPLHLRAGGALTDAPPGPGEAPTAYTYTPGVGSQGIANPAYGYPDLPFAYMWDYSPPDGTAATFTTEPFVEDRTLLGSASLDVWVATDAPDLDLQVTLTEVRPDGQEVFIQQGWLRASQRALDAGRSTDLRPFQTHAEADVQPLEAGEPVLVRVEVFPFGHLLRAGSRLRTWVEAPTTIPQLWAFAPYEVPSDVTVLHDAEHRSRLVLPLVPDDDERVTALPACGTVIRQPCRPDPLGAAAATPAPAGGGGGGGGAERDAGSVVAAGPGTLPASGGGAAPVAAVALLLAAVVARRTLGRAVLARH